MCLDNDNVGIWKQEAITTHITWLEIKRLWSCYWDEHLYCIYPYFVSSNNLFHKEIPDFFQNCFQFYVHLVTCWFLQKGEAFEIRMAIDNSFEVSRNMVEA